MESEALLLRAGAEDVDSEFSRDISLPASPEPKSQLRKRPQTAKMGGAGARAAAYTSKFSLDQAIHAKPFVPRAQSQQVEFQQVQAKA